MAYEQYNGITWYISELPFQSGFSEILFHAEGKDDLGREYTGHAAYRATNPDDDELYFDGIEDIECLTGEFDDDSEFQEEDDEDF